MPTGEVPDEDAGTGELVPSEDLDRQPGYTEDPKELGGLGGGAGEALAPFLWSAFFLSLHRHAADPGQHPRREAVCFWMDFVFRALAALILLTIGVVTAWKALSPLPWT